MNAHEESTEEDIQRQLSGGTAPGPRSFRGRPLAEYKPGLQDLVLKVVYPDDTRSFHDIAFLKILADAFVAPDAKPRDVRLALIVATDNVALFRADVNLHFDELSAADIAEAKRLVTEILPPPPPPENAPV